ncbi:MAG TPA: family 1 glycosylhydrolase, partial [Rhodanobacteraceae bacterium]
MRLRTMTETPALELWAGLECTINRVNDRLVDQLARTGAYARDDIARFASLGIRSLRWPALWERTAPDRSGAPDWGWCDRTLPQIRDAGIEPIVGLMHHGSGPRWTNLLDAQFATGLAEYARAFADRFPWVRRYTPVNEPLTTARFSALYGHWYPHERADRAFASALLNQCRATVLAFQAVRRVNPAAELVLTEDASSTRGTQPVAEQVTFEDERRWLSLDLLTGRVTSAHPLYDYLISEG